MSTDQKVALVTAGHKSLGFEIAKGLLEAGFHVVISARTLEAGQEAVDQLKAFGSASAVSLDLTKADTIRAAVQSIKDQFGRLDSLVNNAANPVPPGDKPGQTHLPSELTSEELSFIFNSNFFGLLAVINACLPLMRASPAGATIVNCSSSRGSLTAPIHLAGKPYLPYSCSKAAVNMATQHYAKEFRDAGEHIIINAVCPAYMTLTPDKPPGFVVGHPAEGAAVAIKMAVLDPMDSSSPSGTFSDKSGPVTW